MKAKVIKSKRAKLLAKASKKKKAPKPEAKPPEMYRVDLELTLYDKGHRFKGCQYVEYTSRKGAEEDFARSLMAHLKRNFCGGRLVLLDGTPDGHIVETWGGIGRVLEAEETERAALEATQKTASQIS